VSTWREYFDVICLNQVNVNQLITRAVEISLARKYHHKNMDFSKIQKSGVSSILLRGQSFPRVALCIDRSGSMSDEFKDPLGTNGEMISRLEFVKREIKEILYHKLKTQDQFSIIFFNTDASHWNKTGLQQATAPNLESAMKYVGGVFPSGGTSFLPALQACFNIPKVQAIYFLSDGEAFEDTNTLMQEVTRLSHPNTSTVIQCHTTAFFAPSRGQSLLKNIARVTGGTFASYGNENDATLTIN
jgi:hypothetical protein